MLFLYFTLRAAVGLQYIDKAYFIHLFIYFGTPPWFDVVCRELDSLSPFQSVHLSGFLKKEIHGVTLLLLEDNSCAFDWIAFRHGFFQA